MRSKGFSVAKGVKEQSVLWSKLWLCQVCWAAKCVQLLRSKMFLRVKCSLVLSVPQPTIETLVGYEQQNKRHLSLFSEIYARDRNVWVGWSLAINQGNHQNFDSSLLPKKVWLIFIVMKQLIQNGWREKSSFSSSANSQYIFAKISWIGPLVSRINWCEGIWCDSIYMAVRLSDISSKTGEKCIFCVFRPFLSLFLTAI